MPISLLIEEETKSSEDEVQLKRLRGKAEKLTRDEREIVMDLMASLLKRREAQTLLSPF